MSKPVIVFDFGGVLLDWNPYYLYRKMLDSDEAIDRFMKEVDFAEWNKHNDSGRPMAEQVRELAGKFPQYAELIYAYDTRFAESLGGAFEGTVKILRKLHGQGYRLFGLSNWSAEKFWQVSPGYGFFDCFEGIVLSGEVGINKPDPGIFKILLERIGRPAGECLLIDDAEANIATAEKLGFQTIRFEGAEQLDGELRKRGIIDNCEGNYN